MTAAPRTIQHQPTKHASPIQEIAQFLKWIYAHRSGYFEAGYIDGDPLTSPYKRAAWKWYTPAQAHQLATYLTQLVSQYKNVYVSSTLYSKRKRDASCALPSHVIFIDDAPERDDYSLSIRTSETSRHAYLLTREDMDPTTRRDLQGRVAAHLGADKSGSDVTQIVRIPGSFNTKRNDCYRVHQEHSSTITYPIDELRQRFPVIKQHSNAPPANIDWHAVERWLGNMDQLLNANGIPWRFKNPTGQARRLLEGKITPLKKDSGEYDPSMARAILITGLVLHGYPDEAIAAICIEKWNFGYASNKGTNDIKADIARYLGTARDKHPEAKITPVQAYPAKQAKPVPNIEPRKRGRPRGLTWDQLRPWLETQRIGPDRIPLTVGMIAEELKVSRTQVERAEREGRQRGEMIRQVSKDRRTSWIVLQRPGADTYGSTGRAKNGIQDREQDTTRASQRTRHITEGTSQSRARTRQEGIWISDTGREAILSTNPRTRRPDIPTTQTREGAQRQAEEDTLGPVKNTHAVPSEIAPTTNFEGTEHRTPTTQNDVAPSLSVTRAPDSTSPEVKPAKVSLRETLTALRAAGARSHPQLKRMLTDYGLSDAWCWDDVRACWQDMLQAEKRQRLMDAISSMSVSKLKNAIQRAEDRATESKQRGDNAWKFWLVYRNRCEREMKRQIAEGKSKRRKQQANDKPPICMLPPNEPDPASVLMPRVTAEEKRLAQSLQRELAVTHNYVLHGGEVGDCANFAQTSEAEGVAPSGGACSSPPAPKRVFGLEVDDGWWKHVAFEREYYLERGDMEQVARCEEILRGRGDGCGAVAPASHSMRVSPG